MTLGKRTSFLCFSKTKQSVSADELVVPKLGCELVNINALAHAYERLEQIAFLFLIWIVSRESVTPFQNQLLVMREFM